jgi:cysteine desulfurase
LEEVPKKCFLNCLEKLCKKFECNCTEIIFTSCGTEANNWILQSAVKDLKIGTIITSKIEYCGIIYHFGSRKTVRIQVDYVDVKPDGSIDCHLVSLLADKRL